MQLFEDCAVMDYWVCTTALALPRFIRPLQILILIPGAGRERQKDQEPSAPRRLSYRRLAARSDKRNSGPELCA